jgi:hypothetical protein
MRSATLYWRWIHIGVLLINLIPGIAANDKCERADLSNQQSDINALTIGWDSQIRNTLIFLLLHPSRQAPARQHHTPP